MAKKETEALSKIVKKLPDFIEALEDKIQIITSRMATLKKSGLIYATEHWRRDNNGVPKYFYLLYPQQMGEKRKREYIGTDPDKIHNAQEGRKRAIEYDGLSKELDELQRYVRQIHQALADAECHLTMAIS